ncbi:MAG: SpoVR family protein [Bacillota bacterium]|nr:SpoVR family protein [Bacillota bacterium]
MIKLGSEYSVRDLQYWNEKIEEIVEASGLNPYPQEFEICNYEDMLGYEAYLGMPSRYPHWSFGKAYERQKTFYRYNLTGLPYEMVINSNPCLAYLMKDNTLLLQILTMAHVYGHNDFFRNNRMFRNGTRAEYTLEMFKSHASRVHEYISDPSIGYARVERILDAAHSLRLQGYRWVEEKHLSEEETKQKLLQKAQPVIRDHPLLNKKERLPLPDLNKIPLEPEEDVLWFLYQYAPLSQWEKDLLQIVREENAYFLPQIETKIMNEGWACHWHYKLLHQLNLPQGLYIEFMKRHNQVVRPHEGSLNPYHLGFRMFEDLEKRFPEDDQTLFEIRRDERDASFIRRYLTEELCRDLHLFEYNKSGKDYVVREVADDEGWKKIRDSLAANVGVHSIPNIKVIEYRKSDHVLVLEHEWEGRELQLQYALETIKYIARLWRGKVRLRTVVRGNPQTLETVEE